MRRFVLSVFFLVLILGCQKEPRPEVSPEASGGTPQVAPPSEPSAPELPTDPFVFTPLPRGPALPAQQLLQQASDEECRAACTKIMEAETATYRSELRGVLAEPESADEVDAMLKGLHDRLRPYCMQRCRESFSKATVGCVLATEDASKAVDCLDRTGAGGG